MGRPVATRIQLSGVVDVEGVEVVVVVVVVDVDVSSQRAGTPDVHFGQN